MESSQQRLKAVPVWLFIYQRERGGGGCGGRREISLRTCAGAGVKLGGVEDKRVRVGAEVAEGLFFDAVMREGGGEGRGGGEEEGKVKKEKKNSRREGQMRREREGGQEKTVTRGSL